MLKIEHISNISIHTDEWRMARLAKITSSMFYTLMGDKMLNTQGVAYLYERVGEELSGVPAKYEVDTAETRWGLIHEADAIRKVGEYLGVDFLITQKLIHEPGSRFSSTPDALNILAKYEGGYDVETIEVKCYPSYGHYIECALCSTPEEIYKVDRKLFWQVIHQMDKCKSLQGYGALYHPEFRMGGFRIIKFRKIHLTSYFTLLQERKQMAERKFNEIREQLINLKN